MISSTLYEHTDIPPGMTCDQYRRRRTASVSSRGRAQSLAVALLYPARMFGHLTEPGPAPGGFPAALHISPSRRPRH